MEKLELTKNLLTANFTEEQTAKLQTLKQQIDAIPNMEAITSLHEDRPEAIAKLMMLSVDVAQVQDFTAFAVISMRWNRGIKDFCYHLTDLIQVTDIDGPVIVAAISQIMTRLIRSQQGNVYFIFDASGLGATLLGHLKQLSVFKRGPSARMFPVNFTGGDGAPRYDPRTGKYNTSVVRIYGEMVRMQEFRRFDYLKSLPLLPELRKQIIAFKKRDSPTGHSVAFGVPDGQGHDDLIAAISMALMIGESKLNPHVRSDALSHAAPNWKTVEVPEAGGSPLGLVGRS